MRVLAFETSSRRGTVAAVERGRVIAARSHEEQDRHAERLPELLEAALADAGWARSDIERVAVGRGPGSFTGLRIGLALGQGIALGLGVACVGVGSLEAMAAAVPQHVPGARVCCVDARRDEVFIAAYDDAGRQLLAPLVLAVGGALAAIGELLGGHGGVLVGEAVALLTTGGGAPGSAWFRSPGADLPDARQVGRLAAELTPAEHPPEPSYVREPDAVLPELRVLFPGTVTA